MLLYFEGLFVFYVQIVVNTDDRPPCTFLDGLLNCSRDVVRENCNEEAAQLMADLVYSVTLPTGEVNYGCTPQAP